MGLTQYYTATTLDGFIAGPDDSLDWLFTRAREPDGPLSYDGFVAQVGAVAMGSTTYEWILEHSESGWPYAQPSWVFTHRRLPLVPGAEIELVSGDVAPVHAELAGGRRPERLDRRRRRPRGPVRRRRGCSTRCS